MPRSKAFRMGSLPGACAASNGAAEAEKKVLRFIWRCYLQYDRKPLPYGRGSVNAVRYRAATVRECPMPRGGPPKAMKTRFADPMESVAWTASSGERLSRHQRNADNLLLDGVLHE